MLSVVFKHGAVELADDTVAIPDSFKDKTEKDNNHAPKKTKSKSVPSTKKDKNKDTDDCILEDGDDALQEREPKPYVFPTLADKESEYEQMAKEIIGEQEENTQSPLEEQKPEDDNLDDALTEEAVEAIDNTSLKLMCDEMLQKAVLQASAILQDAHERAQTDYQALMEQGRADIARDREEGKAFGIAEGSRAQAGNIRACVEQLELAVARIEGKQEEYLAQCEQDIKWLALEIAQKILGDKLEVDELVLYPLVATAVAKQRHVSSITVEISEDAPKLLQKLRDELEKGDDTITIAATKAPIGTCRLQTPEGFIDASLYRQLDNLRDYFGAQGT